MSKIDNLKKAAWYSIENVTSIAFGFISVIIIARLFGPENLGKLSMVQAISFVTLFLVVLGLDHLIVRDLAKDNKDYTLISTTLIIQFIGWLFHVVAVFLLIYLINDKLDFEIVVIVLSVVVTVYFSRATVFRLFFQALNMPRRIAISALISRVASLLYLWYSISNNMEYHLVILFIPLQAIIQFLILLTQFHLYTNVRILSLVNFNLHRAKTIIVEAFPLIISSILFSIFMQADVLLISYFADENDVGIYSSASRIVTHLVFLGHIVTMTFYLSLSERFYKKAYDLDDFITGILIILIFSGFVLSFTVFMLSDTLVNFLYGDKFDGAGKVLAILSWKWLLIFPAALLSRILILKGLAKYDMIKSALAAIFSISANLIFIPYFGITGAAFISVASYFLADFLLYSFFRKTRPIFLMTVRSLFLIFLKPNVAFKLVIKVLSIKS